MKMMLHSDLRRVSSGCSSLEGCISKYDCASVGDCAFVGDCDSVGGAPRGDSVQDKVRPGTGREGALGYKVRPGTGREGALGYKVRPPSGREGALGYKVRPGTGREGALGRPPSGREGSLGCVRCDPPRFEYCPKEHRREARLLQEPVLLPRVGFTSVLLRQRSESIGSTYP